MHHKVLYILYILLECFIVLVLVKILYGRPVISALRRCHGKT